MKIETKVNYKQNKDIKYLTTTTIRNQKGPTQIESVDGIEVWACR
jgi:hypothetical protein